MFPSGQRQASGSASASASGGAPLHDFHRLALAVPGGPEQFCDFRRGVFLPQVATDTGWDLDTFMGELCSQKAGLPRTAWKDPQTDLYTFTAEIFSD